LVAQIKFFIAIGKAIQILPNIWKKVAYSWPTPYMWILTSKATKLCTQIGVNAHKGAYKYKVPTVSKE
jgi:hypothetical protein